MDTRSLPMRIMRSLLVGIVSVSIPRIYAWGDTDYITWGGDFSRTSYQNNHNLDPNVVMSSSFGQIFKTTFPGNFQGLAAEQIFASPLVYTGNDGIQYIYVATTQNNLYKLDAKTGAIITSRNLHVPFLQVELESCVDINPLIGITATGIIDPETGIWYVTSKTYADQFQNGNFSVSNPPGRLNGRYWQHAVHTEDLSEVTGWPIPLDGTIFRNNPNRMFVGGNQHSRPGAFIVGDYLYTGYASHCIQYNYTGAIIGFNKKTGAIVEAFATEGGPELNTVKGGGVWMSGGGLAYDGKGSMFFATGNGYASQLKATGNAVPGRSPPSSLEEAAVNAKINDDGTITIIDFFMPYEKVALDGGDRDLGTTPLVLLPPDVFTCPNHRRIGVVTGKTGKTYWLNLDNLGGYQQGPNNGDNVIQVYQNENSVYAGTGMIPLGGGYVYVPVTQFKTHVFKFACDSFGNATFAHVTDTPDVNAYILGTSAAAITTINDQDGTGLLWVNDVQGVGLRVYDPIPPANGGPLRSLRNFTIPGVTKFSHPSFGDGRVYISTNQGFLYGFGSPVQNILNCSAPNFGAVPINTASQPTTITCTALNQTTIQSIAFSDNSTDFQILNIPLLPLSLSVGQTFSFIAVANPANVGATSEDIMIGLQNGVAGYASQSIVTLRAKGDSVAPLLAVSPNSVTFNVIAGMLPSQQPSLWWNLGDTTLTFTGAGFSTVSANGPWIQPNATSDGQWQVGDFTFSAPPATLAPGASAPMSITYAPTTPGNDTVWFMTNSDGGSAVFTAFGVAGTQPKAVVEFQTPDGTGWVPYDNMTAFSFGTVYEGQTRNLLFRLTNGGGPLAVPLSVSVSKPPYGIPGIIGKSNNIDLAEGSFIPAGESQTANLYCAVPKSPVNLPSYNGSTVWTMNTNDPTLGKLFIQFFCQAGIEQVGPLLPNGTAQYGYVGCFQEGQQGRQLAVQAYVDSVNNTNTKCTTTCSQLGYVFAGTEFVQECWCGNAIPITLVSDGNCNYGCTGNIGQTCGGNGIFHNSTYLSLFADSTKFNGNTNSPPLSLTQSVGQYQFAGCYAEPSGKTVVLNATSSPFMTVEYCAAWCGSKYPYFGLEWAQECSCGFTLNPASYVVDPSQCSYTCKGNNSEYCGGSQRMQLYQYNPNLSTSSSIFSTITLSSSTSSAVVSSSSSVPVVVSPTSSSTSMSSSTGVSSSSSIPVVVPSSTSMTSMTSMTSSTLVSTSSSVPVVVPSTTSSTSMTSSTGNQSASPPVTVSSMSSTTSSATVSSSTSSVMISSSSSTMVVSPTMSSSSMSMTSSSIMVSSSSSMVVVSPTIILPTTSSSAMSSMSSSTTTSMTSSTASSMTSSTLSSMVVSSSSASSTSAMPTATPIPGSPLSLYTYIGCFIDVPSRVLGGRFVANSSVSLDMCASFCAGYSFFGTEYSRECYCGNGIPLNTYMATDGRCNTPCAGNSSEICGGGWGLSTYQLTPSSMGNPSPINGYTSMGCYAEKPNGRALKYVWYSNSLTAESCAAQAAAYGYAYFGLEYGRECWMDNVLDGAIMGPQSNCGISCVGNLFENCGGGDYMQLYGNGSVTNVPSTSSSMSSSTTPVGIPTTFSPITISSSATSSTSMSSSSTTMVSSSSTMSTSPSSSLSSSSTTMVSSSSTMSTSPSSSLSSSAMVAPPNPGPGLSLTSTSLTSVSTTIFSSATPSATGSSTGSYSFVGCFQDNAWAGMGRALRAMPVLRSPNMTPKLCSNYCSQFAYFGLEYSQECWCGPFLKNSTQTPLSDCSYPCSGDATTFCGALGRLSVYHSSDPSKVSIDPAVPASPIGNYTYLNCEVDTGMPRLLPQTVFAPNMASNASVEACLSLAEAWKYQYAGLEFGNECWLGNSLTNVTANPQASESDCNMSCVGARGELCGGPNRINVWMRKAGM